MLIAIYASISYKRERERERVNKYFTKRRRQVLNRNSEDGKRKNSGRKKNRNIISIDTQRLQSTGRKLNLKKPFPQRDELYRLAFYFFLSFIVPGYD